MRAGLAIQLALAALLTCAAAAAAQPVSGPRETVDNRLTTTRPNSPTGFTYRATYHAAGDPKGRPPYMRKMISYAPPGLRYDTSVPARCTASDLELAARGAAACPAASRVGGGTTDGLWLDRFASTLKVDVFNNAGQQIFVVASPGEASVSRGTIQPDGSVEFASPTCYPVTDPCPFDNALHLGSSITVPPYTRRIGGRLRSYYTTPPRCPTSSSWKVPIRFWWSDGAVDTVVVKQPCRRPRA
jgi:hypothetical protein